ncbi:asparagine synthase (glutamine-hydrolyzing) [Methylobacterium sp. J-070]|uniref:asparagine synthase (glutamine-hydrolyzing) n=1 Tax=Methylobacterium sp. J-070 TaxID=2836650 RepID=UPI001FBA30AE|nr:asparagine synthase (glutamine-hydrolyzing) [Methylobacterium sp. J-070]MCJ2054927.1 asparagine synthase (glutamine-hydrolyzing) [Methylobacterium sp. J-070]
MCGIAGAVSLQGGPIPRLDQILTAMGGLIAHRGPDGEGTWTNSSRSCGLVHRRLSIIDATPSGSQPMVGQDGSVVTFNGEIYNYVELAERLSRDWTFRSRSDTETILAGYARWGLDCLSELRGMFAFAIWDGARLVAARDRFGIKPLYYAVVRDVLYFASEPKALLPIMPDVVTDRDALAEYLTFQYTIGEQTLFKGIKALLPGHTLIVANGSIEVRKYWDIQYEIDADHTEHWFAEEMRRRLHDSVRLHLRADTEIGAYVSGGIDSSLVASLAARQDSRVTRAFHGKFVEHDGYDESGFAAEACAHAGLDLHQIAITGQDFNDNIERVVYHLDTPVGGPGSFAQFMVSGLAARHVKVVLGGQGGDEIFAGYARYLIAYLEQCLKAAIEGTQRNGNFVVTPESIIPHLRVLQEYKPLIQQLFSKGLFGPLDERYFALIDRSSDTTAEIDWQALDRRGVFERYTAIFNSARNVRKEAYLDSMMHFDFKGLLPALLQVEDRMSMAHGLEARVPLLDHPVVELAATVPAIVKFQGGQMKHFLKTTFRQDIPEALIGRRDKMGFPVPIKEWLTGPSQAMFADLFSSRAARERRFINAPVILENFQAAGRYSRKAWGLLNIELWHRIFHDRAAQYRRLVDEAVPKAAAG